ncbi:MAG: Rpn family recombination-promoting nuclease/putative transposase [Deltaproteobacteria bacterium]|nr:Rpn family recombination-promoting nuclease/putative transposase [Deltaproteobacteria bacterium]
MTEETRDQIERDLLSPLADPVVTELYKNLEVGGKAAQDFISAVLGECGLEFGKIVRLSPQRKLSHVDSRSFYVDVYAESDAGVTVIYEVQLYFDKSFVDRTVLQTSYFFAEKMEPGIKTTELSDKAPTIYVISILGDERNCRTSNKELLQPYYITSQKKPPELATRHFGLFYVQLPYLPLAKADYANKFYC